MFPGRCLARFLCDSVAGIRTLNSGTCGSAARRSFMTKSCAEGSAAEVAQAGFYDVEVAVVVFASLQLLHFVSRLLH